MSAKALAQPLCVTSTLINQIMREKRSITADTALRLASYLVVMQKADNLQALYCLKRAEQESGGKINKEI